MGQKVHPRIFRTGVIYSWDSKWFSQRDFAKLLQEDQKIREFIRAKLKDAFLDRIEIERTSRAVTITLHTAKPGMIIGKGGTGIEDLKKQLRAKLVKKPTDKLNLNLNVVEVGNPSLYANLVMQSMIGEIEKRMPFRRVLKQHLDRVQKAGAKGVKLAIGGRLNGAEIARREKLAWGSIPLQNLRADIDYASGFAKTLYGTIGIKVWIYRGEVFDADLNKPTVVAAAPDRRRPARFQR
ncbi:30S ribosomal protein S3 [Candidatus Uhrbacteria bacterium RIFCSPHIGHO2_02_FULL_60_10]|uniref:Small ribosomal subunit protein uS3 n=1 Tax=Candidatus Uhrbacteria bacterium RIFCSPHIGHO2_02_FULL_60_10 TaxID=1802392 RepID=A0A1F7U464_9BACT|nr:MAG: 30S ribosomal protein S3 [Candidatus Uhrbacteria bacterium RIFCSPHIGHO2_02_FULL_60_10]